MEPKSYSRWSQVHRMRLEGLIGSHASASISVPTNNRGPVENSIESGASFFWRLGGHLGIPDRIISSLRFRYACLYWWYRRCAPRILLGELHIAVLRTKEIMQSNAVIQGVGIPPCPVDIPPGDRYKYKIACRKSIERLCREFRWLDLLDIRTLGEAFRDGAQWSCHSPYNPPTSGEFYSRTDYVPKPAVRAK